MIKYNWEAIKKYTNNKPELVIDYFKNIYVLQGEMYSYMQANKFARDIVNAKGIKSSYILNILDLVKNDEKATLTEQYIYIDLASKRDAFSLFNSKGRKRYLHEWEVAGDYDIKKLEINKLLMISDKKIYFIYEEGDDYGNGI